MTVLLVGKALLLTFLVVACGVVVITYIRRRRAGVRSWVNPYAAPYLGMETGHVPEVPPPSPVAERSAGYPPPGFPGRPAVQRPDADDSQQR